MTNVSERFLRPWSGAARAFMLASLIGSLNAAVISIPSSSLIPSTTYYTDSIGGGLGPAAVMTGGGNAANIGGTRNDDGFSGPINLGFTLNFFGTSYSQFWANNNGNISFGNGIADFTPTGPQGASQPIISPFFADVDTRNPASGLLHVRTDIANEVIVTWDQVGYFDQNADKLNSFQLVLRGSSFSVPSGEGQIGFFYKGMTWETGDASGGINGFGGTPAAVGFGDGASNGEILQGSAQNGIAALANNEHIWFTLDNNGVPIPMPPPVPPSEVPEPSTIGMLSFGLGTLVWARYKSKTGVKA